jgi:hypothetical protein
MDRLSWSEKMRTVSLLLGIAFVSTMSDPAYAYRANATAFNGHHRGFKCYNLYERCQASHSEPLCKKRYDAAVAAGGIWGNNQQYCFLN